MNLLSINGSNECKFVFSCVSDMIHPPIHRLCLLLIGMLTCQSPTVSGLFEWLRRMDAPPPATESPPPGAVVPVPLAKDAKFEIATADEKFLAEAKHLEISPLESCHYRVRTDEIATLWFRFHPVLKRNLLLSSFFFSDQM